jgi:hypothetical protein
MGGHCQAGCAGGAHRLCGSDFVVRPNKGAVIGSGFLFGDEGQARVPGAVVHQCSNRPHLALAQALKINKGDKGGAQAPAGISSYARF